MSTLIQTTHSEGIKKDFHHTKSHPMKKNLLVVALIICAVAFAATDAVETPEQQRKWVHSPIRESGSVSLEWVIDASDAIVQAKIDAELQPRLEKFHKRPVAGKDAWTPDDPLRLRAICELYEPNDQIVFFLWHDAKNNTWRIFDYIPLLSDAIRKERLRASQELLPPEDQPDRRMHHFWKERDAGLTWLAIDKTGKWIGDDAVILDRITRRVKAGSRIPQGADRQAVLDDKSKFGGFYIYEPQEPSVSSAEFPVVLVPPDPEYRALFLKAVRNLPSHVGQLPAFELITNYKDEEVIAALKARLNDDLVNEVWYEQPGRKLRGNTYFIQTPDDPPLKPEPNIEKSRTYVIRKAAWEALRKMDVRVAPPKLNP